MSRQITVFSTTYCATCNQLKKWLDSKNISYTSINLEEHPEMQAEVLEKSGSMSVPVSFITDDTNPEYFDVVTGADYSAITKAMSVA